MDLARVMDEIGDRLDTIDGLRVFRYPPDDVTPPAAIVSYPESYTYDETFGRGMDRMSLPVIVLVGGVSDRSSRDQLGAYINGDGDRSIKEVIEAGEYTAFDSVRVTEAVFDAIRMADADYVAATLTLDIAGTGAS